MKREQEEIASIEGALMMLDNVTPHVAVPVQAIQCNEVIVTTLSDETGKYAFVDLEPGWYQVRCQVLEGYVYPTLTANSGWLRSKLVKQQSARFGIP